MKTTTSVGVAFAIAVGLLSPMAAHAQLSASQAITMLDSTSADEVRMAIEALGLSGSASGVAPLSARIHRGLPPDILETAIDTLAVLGRPEAGPVLFELLTHRRPAIRLRAIQAIATCAPRGADRALIAALNDSSPEVRGAAASTLAQLHATSAIDPLFLAFEHQVAEAGDALAALARPNDVERITAFMGRVPFTTLRSMLLTLLGRTDLPQRARLDLVGRIGELATGEARSLLEEFAQTISNPRDAVRRAAEDAAARIAN